MLCSTGPRVQFLSAEDAFSNEMVPHETGMESLQCGFQYRDIFQVDSVVPKEMALWELLAARLSLQKTFIFKGLN